MFGVFHVPIWGLLLETRAKQIDRCLEFFDKLFRSGMSRHRPDPFESSHVLFFQAIKFPDEDIQRMRNR